MKAKIVSLSALLFLLVLGAFLTGMWATYKNWWPWQKTTEMRVAWRSYRDTGLLLPEDSYARRVADQPDAEITLGDQSKVAPGYWVINRYDAQSKRYLLDLRDEAGVLVSTRPLEYSRLVKGGSPNEFIHIATMLPDGSVLVVFDDATALARLDACGDPIWAKTDQVYHHSIEAGADGYWTWQSAIWNGGEDQRMVRFDAETGEILESIDLIDDLIAKSPANALAMRIPEGFKFDRTTQLGDRADIFHPNDVEELLPSMAAAFPQFTAGDLLVSFRNIDMLAVIDRTTHDILWSQYGPWLHQHDADFQPDGTITVFSNNTDHFRSTLIQVDPKTGIARDLFHATGLVFDSFIMGKHQRLPNGNWLIDSTMQGRVMEVTPQGEIVKDYNNIIDTNFTGVVPYAEHLRPGYLKTIPTCEE